MTNQLTDAWKILIRPNKPPYQISDLGQNLQIINNTKYTRHDFTYCNVNSFLIHCSLFYPDEVLFNDSTATGGNMSLDSNSFNNKNSEESFLKPSKKNSKINNKAGFERIEKKPLLVYLHSQTGNRVEGQHLLQHCAKRRIALLLFDFAGCGKSEGDYVSLGYHEKNDLDGVINFVSKNYPIGNISLWGRSMGAVTAILYAEKNSSKITSMILDSPFNELSTVVKEYAAKNFNLPGILLTMAIKMISGNIEKKIGYNIFDLNPGKAAKKIIVPAQFICGKNDKLVPPKTVIDIYKNYKAKKKVLLNSDADHNDEREAHLIDSAFSLVTDEFFKATYKDLAKEEEQKEMETKNNFIPSSMSTINQSVSMKDLSFTKGSTRGLEKNKIAKVQNFGSYNQLESLMIETPENSMDTRLVSDSRRRDNSVQPQSIFNEYDTVNTNNMMKKNPYKTYGNNLSHNEKEVSNVDPKASNYSSSKNPLASRARPSNLKSSKNLGSKNFSIDDREMSVGPKLSQYLGSKNVPLDDREMNVDPKLSQYLSSKNVPLDDREMNVDPKLSQFSISRNPLENRTRTNSISQTLGLAIDPTSMKYKGTESYNNSNVKKQIFDETNKIFNSSEQIKQKLGDMPDELFENEFDEFKIKRFKYISGHNPLESRLDSSKV